MTQPLDVWGIADSEPDPDEANRRFQEEEDFREEWEAYQDRLAEKSDDAYQRYRRRREDQ